MKLEQREEKRASGRASEFHSGGLRARVSGRGIANSLFLGEPVSWPHRVVTAQKGNNVRRHGRNLRLSLRWYGMGQDAGKARGKRELGDSEQELVGIRKQAENRAQTRRCLLSAVLTLDARENALADARRVVFRGAIRSAVPGEQLGGRLGGTWRRAVPNGACVASVASVAGGWPRNPCLRWLVSPGLRRGALRRLRQMRRSNVECRNRRLTLKSDFELLSFFSGIREVERSDGTGDGERSVACRSGRTVRRRPGWLHL